MSNLILKCKQFWINKKEYPVFGSRLRRFYELMWLIPHLKGNSILDLGCGDGTLLELINKTSNIKKYYGYDISENLLKKVGSFVKTKKYDFYKAESLPKTDNAVLFGVINYLLDDKSLNRLLRKINSPLIFIKTPCTNKDLRIYTNSRIGKEYVSYYRTLDHVIDLISKHFRILEIVRAYPKKIDSKFGSVMYFIKAQK